MSGLLDELEQEVHEHAKSTSEPPEALATGDVPDTAVPDTAVPAASSPSKPSADSEPGPAERAADRFAADAQRLIETCEAELSGNPGPGKAARLHFEVARLYETPLDDLRRAAAHYQEAYNRWPEHLPTIRGARRVLLARKSYQAALPLFDAEARITPDPRRKAAIYHAKARLLEDVLGSSEDARKAIATALELDRGDPTLLKAAEQLELEAGDHQALCRTYEREANAVSADPRHRAALITQRARLVEHKEEDVDTAVELYETALRLDPESHTALSSLKRLHHSRRRFRDLIRVLQLEAERTTDPTVRTTALYRIGRLHTERLGNQSEALAALEKAVREAPDDPLVLTELTYLYASTERWEPLAEALERLARGAHDPAERVALMERIARIQDERLGNAEEAVRWYRSALSLSPTHIPLLQALGKLLARMGDWQTLVEVHLTEAESAEGAERRATAHARAAEILETHLDKPDEAAEHHGRALSQVPGYAPSFKALSRLLAQAERWRELVELYERAVDQAEDETRKVTFLLKIGGIYEDDLGEHAQAAHAYRRVIEKHPDHLGAIHALQRATERAGRYQELVEALELEAEHAEDDGQVVSLLRRAGEVLDGHLGDRDGALVRFRRVLSLDPQHVGAIVSLGRIYHRAGRWEDLLDIYKRELDLLPRGPSAVALLQKMGELCEERIGKDEDALEYYRKAIEIDPTCRPALRSLARKLAASGQWEELAETLELQLSGLTDGASKARTGFRIGEIYEEHLKQPERALTSYAQALKAAPGYRPAADALARLRAEQKQWPQLVDDLEREATSTPDPTLAISALMREGEIWTDELDEPRRAIGCFERVLQSHPTHVGALMALEPLYRRVGAWASLAHVYATQASVLTDVGARATALRELARIQAARGVDGDVRDTYEAVIQLLPDDGGALDALEELALARGDRRMLVQVDTRLAGHAEDRSVRAAHLTRLAESLELLDDPRALDAYRSALDSDPENLGATRGLSRLAERTGDPAALAEAARREADVATDGQVAAQLLVRSAAVRTEQLDDQEGAQDDLERALELAPDHAEAAERLSHMLRASHHEARLADLLSRAASSAKSPERVAGLWMEVAHIQADVLDNLPGAISSLNRVLRSATNHIATLRKLAELYGRDGQWTEAVNLLSRVVQLAPDREVLRDTHLELAELWDERLGETSRALVSLQAVLALDPENRAALSRLSALQEKENKISQAADTAIRLVQASTDPADRADALLRLARLESARDNEQACIAALMEAVTYQGPGSESALELKSRTQTAGEWEDYANAVTRHLERVSEAGGDTTPVYLELGRVRQDQLAQPHTAVEVLRRGIEVVAQPNIIRAELATRLRMAGLHDEAIEELRTLLAEDTCRVDAWRDLIRNYQASGRVEETRLSTMLLSVLKVTNEKERAVLDAHPPRPARATVGSLGVEVLRQLAPQGPAEAAATELLVALVPGLTKIYPADLESFGLSTRDRVTSRQGHPLRALAERIGSAFGVEDFELYLHRARNKGVSVELSSPPSILIPATLGELPQPERVFLLSRPLAIIAQGLHPLLKLTPREVEVWLASASRNLTPGHGSGLTSEELLDERARQIHKALPRRARKGLEDIVGRYVAAPRLEFARWNEGIMRAAQRVSALLADDLPSCVDVVRRTDRSLSGLEGAALVRTSPTVEDLMQFWVSDAAHALRKRAGMLESEAD